MSARSAAWPELSLLASNSFIALRGPRELAPGDVQTRSCLGDCALSNPRASLYTPLMTFTQRIPAERLLGLDVHEGNKLHVIAVLNSSFVEQVRRAEEPPKVRGKASAW